METNGFVIKNNFYKNINAYYGFNGSFVSLINAEMFSNEVSCRLMIEKICHTYKEVEAYNKENLEVKKVVVKIVE